MKRILCAVFGMIILINTVFLAGCQQNDESSGQTTATKTQDNNFSLSALDYVKGITAGWNLGNTFEACYTWGNIPKENPSVEQVETGWNNPVTSQEMFDKLHESGINAVRLPVTWDLFINEKDGTYTIDSKWMKRVKEVVGYAYKHNMYVIVDMHHDDRIWFDLAYEGEQWTKAKSKYEAVWKIIANEFKDYNEKLILEGANEVLASTGKDEKGNTTYDWWGVDQETFEKLNELHKLFIDTVRGTGGNNKKRYLMIPTYGAQWYVHQMENLDIPKDDHIIVDIHWYSTTKETYEYDKYFGDMVNQLVYFKIAVILGECGIRNDASESDKLEWAKNYIGTANTYGLKCFLWDDGGNYQVLNRKTCEWNSDAFIKAVIQNATKEPTPTTTAENNYQ